MKTFLKKYILVIVLLGALATALPFVKWISVATVEEAIEDGYSHISYDTLSFSDLVWEGLKAISSEHMDSVEIISFAVLFGICLVEISQIVAAILKKQNIVLYTSIVLFSIFLALLIIGFKNGHDLVICYGYYIYLIIQAILLFISPSSTKRSVGIAT